jgi:hypothetical protein
MDGSKSFSGKRSPAVAARDPKSHAERLCAAHIDVLQPPLW